MKKGEITIVGIGPGGKEDMTSAALSAIRQSDVIVGYKYYFRFINDVMKAGAQCVDTCMMDECERVEEAFRLARAGYGVCVISSGDAGIYGMASLVWEMKRALDSEITVTAIPGISAFQKAASLLGAPVGHDFCVISLSDLMTDWEVIERRIMAAATGDFVTVVYNPKSERRYWQLYRLKELFLAEGRSPETPVGTVRQAGRPEQQVHLTTLEKFDPETADMFTVIIIGNSQSYRWNHSFITPRGYYREKPDDESVGTGQDIMIRSFLTIGKRLKNKDVPLDHKWALLHAIHTTADFEMEQLLYTDTNAVASLYQMITGGRIKTIVTDVTMVTSGIRKGAVERLGLEVKCYLHDERMAELAKTNRLTRTQAGIRLAVKEHPDALYVFGNAPTALMELCELIRKGEAAPAGIVAAPVGFVHVKESKYRLKPFTTIPKLIIEGGKGGSNLAATLVNAILTFDDAEHLKPGRDV